MGLLTSATAEWGLGACMEARLGKWLPQLDYETYINLRAFLA